MDIRKANKRLHVRVTFTEEVLGTLPNNHELHDTYIASKAPDAPSREEEVAAMGIGDAVELGMTVFPRTEDGIPYFWNYQIEGFLKESVKCVKKHYPGSECSMVKANRQAVDNAIFVMPRVIPVHMNGVVGDCQRPLRAQTAQGERIALAHSESIPAGSYIEFYIELAPTLGKGIDLNEVIREAMDYGQLKGIGQWRNSGKGRFTWEVIEDAA